VFPVRYELRFYIPEDRILHSPRLENHKTSIVYGKFCRITKDQIYIHFLKRSSYTSMKFR
jgi:hypothetical protein